MLLHFCAIMNANQERKIYIAPGYGRKQQGRNRSSVPPLYDISSVHSSALGIAALPAHDTAALMFQLCAAFRAKVHFTGHIVFSFYRARLRLRGSRHGAGSELRNGGPFAKFHLLTVNTLNGFRNRVRTGGAFQAGLTDCGRTADSLKLIDNAFYINAAAQGNGSQPCGRLRLRRAAARFAGIGEYLADSLVVIVYRNI